MRHSPAFILAVIAASCFSPVLEKQCEKDLDCGSGYRCIAQACVPGSGTGGGSSTGGGLGGAGNGGGSATGGGAVGGGSGAGGGGNLLCGPQNCDGCCLGNICLGKPSQHQGSCGSGGRQCLSCGPGSTCNDGACFGGRCDSTTCNGCCINDTCITVGQQNMFQCGLGGGTCQTCGSTNACVNGTCQTTTCSPANCNGCCFRNVCIPPPSQSSGMCGSGGAECASCGPNGQCTNGVCNQNLCNAMSCSGCCVGNACLPIPNQSPVNCGRMGQQCMSCAPGQTCQAGACVGGGCGPATCPGGCCLNGSCAPGNDPFSCGIGGQACTVCPAGSQCLRGSCQGCSPTTCPTGCCQFGFCQGGNLDSACGNFGQQCNQCPSGQTCQAQKCTPVSNAAVGTPCTSAFDCSSLGPGAICKQVTSSGSGIYQGGYCTLRCGTGAACPTGSSCGSAPAAGENDNICLANCGGAAQCRQPGYACYSFGGAFNACWIFPTPGLDGGTRPDAGAGRAIGQPCTDNFQCQPPGNAFCLPEQISMLNTGYVGGYCSRNCGGGQPCPGGSVCITEVFGGVTNTSCKAVCFNPGGGQGVCRTGYICQPSPSGLSWCGPRCSNQAFPCPSGGTCNVNTGYCL